MLPSDKHKSFALGFTCCLLMFLSLLCLLLEIGKGERGSGRIELVDEGLTHLLAEAKGQQSPERPPKSGNGRKDSSAN